MYPKYFGLQEPSFSIAPDPHFLFLSEQHREALAHLVYGAGENGGFVLLTGEVGTGKTTVCRAFLERLPEGVDVALVLNPAMTANELLLNICDEFHIEVPEGERSVKLLVDRLNRYLLDAHAAGRRPVLMIDEAQNLRPKVMEQIRLLTNLETTKHKLLQIFLVGQPELRQMLERESLRQINQRVTARFHLGPFGVAETAEYIRHRVAVAGVDRPLFTAAAIRRIHKVSGGIPRLINILCDRALLGASVTRANQVTPAIVARAAREVGGPGWMQHPVPVVRPAFAVAASLSLLLVAGWLAFGALQGDPNELIAALISGERAAPAQTEDRAALVAEVEPAQDDPVSTDAAPQVPDGGPVEIAASEVTVPAADELPRVEAMRSASQPATDEVADVVAAHPPGTASLPRVSLAALAPESADETLDRLAMPLSSAVPVLLRRWGVYVSDLGGGDPCLRVNQFGLRCEQEEGRLSHVRFFDRPVLLRVPDANGLPRYLVLGALDEDYGALDLEDATELVPIEGLERVWTGKYIVIWQPPPTGAPLIGPGASVDSVRWLRRMIAATPQSSLTDVESGSFDTGLGRALKRFQSTKGLVADGIAGPRTLIQLHNAAVVGGIPRLMSPELAAKAAVTTAGTP